jgi:hypothetical protein
MATWGDPGTETFRKKHIREARAAGTVALVNAQIHAITARLIEGLSDHVDFHGEEVVSYDPDGTEAQRLGLALHVALPLPPAPELTALVGKWGFDGFQVDGSDLVELRFAGTPEQALRLNDEALALHYDRLETDDVSGPTPIRWPGLRDLVAGDSGQDVVFLRLFLNAGDPDAPVDEGLFDAVRLFQQRRGAPVTGLIDVHLWYRILPARRPHISVGDSGLVVRVLQAALGAYEGATTRVTGTWGVLTSRDVRTLQRDYSLRTGQFVRAPEWALVLGPVVDRVETARRAVQGVGVPLPPKPVPIELPDVHLTPSSVHSPVASDRLVPLAGLPGPIADLPPASIPEEVRERAAAPAKTPAKKTTAAKPRTARQAPKKTPTS